MLNSMQHGSKPGTYTGAQSATIGVKRVAPDPHHTRTKAHVGAKQSAHKAARAGSQ